jgi:D-alanyl-lipoteichoic acid acyltransferase DltB (MBOAT superfamily)
MPVGVSFFTFRSMSYSFDVYRRKLEPTRSLPLYLTYVSFFPQLLAGPIERATHLLPQLQKPAPFSQHQAVDGLRQILWGFFKKTVVADNCTPLVNDIFSNHHEYSGSTLLVGALLFTFQIYGDFSGYSDIAVGTAKLLGFDLKPNFAYPYFSRNIAEFWRRWHISLSTWFRDYLYIPLGGNRGSKVQQVRNIFVVFLVSGLWHGANWTFVVWGFLHALFLLPLTLSERRKTESDVVAAGRLLPSLGEVARVGLTFAAVAVAWVFFRADSVGLAFDYVLRMFDLRQLGSPQIMPTRVALYIAIMLGVEWLNRDKEHGLSVVRAPRGVRWACYLSLSYAVALLSADAQTFLYFKF